MELYDFQQAVLARTEGQKRVAYYLDMGLGKTFIGAEHMDQIGNSINLVICQKSKIPDWVNHFRDNYPDYEIYTLTGKDGLQEFLTTEEKAVGIINYELTFRRLELTKIRHFTLMLDESSLIANEHAKRSKVCLKLGRLADAVILLSGTPTAGKYERLWSQCQMLGWNITKQTYWSSYICSEWEDFGGFFHQVVTGYKNVDHLKQKLAEHGAVFLKTSEVMTLPEQVEQTIWCKPSRQYWKFLKDSYAKFLWDGEQIELVGDNVLTRILYARQLCGAYSKEKLQAFDDLLDSTDDSLVVFYCYNQELQELQGIAEKHDRRVGIVNGKQKDLPEGHDILLVQYQAGAYGLNLQGFSNKIVYYTLPLGKGSCDMWQQSKKRIHRIGQKQTCIYYYLMTKNSIETRNLQALQEGTDLTNDLFTSWWDERKI